MAKGNWQYIESASLGQTVAYDWNSGWLFCEDGTRYSPAELALVTSNWTAPPPDGIPLQVHLVKKQFGGTIVSAGEQQQAEKTGTEEKRIKKAK